MNYHITIVFVYIIVNLQTAALFSTWSVASDEKCQFTINNGLMISFSESPFLFVNSFKTKDLTECRTSCCTHETCNGYVWDVNDISGDNCKLLKCSSQGQDCKKALKGSSTSGEVGFITGISDIPQVQTTITTPHQNQATKQKASTIKALDNSITWLKQRLGVDAPNHMNYKNGSAKTETRLKGNAITIRKEFNKATKKDGLKSQVSNSSHPNKGISKISKVTALPHHYSSVSSVVNSLSVKPKEKDDVHAHTNNASLTVALLFGLGFMVTVIYMVGRRWVEGVKDYHRRGYTRISYLLNGV